MVTLRHCRALSTTNGQRSGMRRQAWTRPRGLLADGCHRVVRISTSPTLKRTERRPLVLSGTRMEVHGTAPQAWIWAPSLNGERRTLRGVHSNWDSFRFASGAVIMTARMMAMVIMSAWTTATMATDMALAILTQTGLVRRGKSGVVMPGTKQSYHAYLTRILCVQKWRRDAGLRLTRQCCSSVSTVQYSQLQCKTAGPRN